MTRPGTSAFALATVLFFLSGALGLGYEIVWIRKAALVVGASQIALSTVLTAFFLGLGLGSYFVGRRRISRRRSPLFVYGLFEVAVGVFALFFPELFRGLEAAYGALYPFFEGSGAGLFALRFALLFLLFLPPTFFLGGTLPLLLDGLVEKDASVGSRTSLLYGVNILGAVAGVLVTSYFTIPGAGMNGSSRLFGVGNLAIGVVAIAAFRNRAPLHATETPAIVPRFFLGAAFASGFIAIGYQVAWARYFSLFNTGTVYLTAVLLAVYLLALGMGSLGLSPLLKAGLRPLRVLCVAQALAPILALNTLEAWRAAEYRYSIEAQPGVSPPVAIDTLEIGLPPGNPHYFRFASEDLDAIFFAPFFQVGLVIFLPVLLLGTGLPSIIAAASRSSESLRSASGRLVFWNTLGSSAGGFAVGYGCIPWLGLNGTLLVLAAGSLGLGAAAAFRDRSESARLDAPPGRRERRLDPMPSPAGGRRWPHPALLALLAAGLLASLLFLRREDVTPYTIKFHGYGRDPEMGYDPDAKPAPRPGHMPLTQVVEGPLTTSFLFENDESARIGSGNVCLAVAYKKSFSSQAVQGHVPVLFYPGTGLPKRCLGICLGSGQSFGALLLYPIESLDVVDISSEIVDLSLRSFAPYQHRLGQDSRVKVHLDDGRHFVDRAPDGSYDVISMEPPPPTAEGVASLYSVEFYREARRILREGGVFMQWLPLYRVTPHDACGIIRTQADVFPETFVVKVFGDDFMVVSYLAKPKIPLDAIRERVKVFRTERLLEGQRWSPYSKHDIASFEGVLALLLMGPEDVRRLDAPSPYDDDRQILSYTSGDRRLLRRYEGPALSRLSFAALELSRVEDLKDYFDPPLSAEVAAEVTVERAASLYAFGLQDPRALDAELAAMKASSDPVDRVRHALNLAAAFDASLAKKKAFEFLGEACAAAQAAPGAATPEVLAAARRIARNRLVAFEGEVARGIAELEARFGRQPITSALREELTAFRERERARRAPYWLE
jgi:spermidine synthase